jgi:2-dehydropantoate 2-reductase
MRYLIAGAGVTGCYTAWRMQEKGMDVTLLARGEKLERFGREGIQLQELFSGTRHTARVPLMGPDERKPFDSVLVFVQANHVHTILPTLAEIPEAQRFAFMGNNTGGFEQAGNALGRDRVLSGFGSVGGTWKDAICVYVDAPSQDAAPYDRFVLGAPFVESLKEREVLQADLTAGGFYATVYEPIQDWHLTHAAFVSCLAAALYRCDTDNYRLANDRPTLTLTLRATKEAFRALRAAGHTLLPRKMAIMGFMPIPLLRGRVAATLNTRFAEIGLAGHADVARDEMRSLGRDILAIAERSSVRCDALRELLGDM